MAATGSAASRAASATASSLTGMPLRKAIPASRSRSSGSEEASWLTLAPPAALAVRQPPSCPQPWGTATVPRATSSVSRAVSSISPWAEPSLQVAPSSTPAAAASSGWIRAACSRPPRINSAALCIQELWERSSRRPIRRRGKSGSAPFCAARRSASARISGTSRWTRRSRWRTFLPSTPPRRCSSRTIPCGLRRSFETLRPPRRSPKRSPCGPILRSRSTRRSGERRIPARPRMRAIRTLEGTIPIRFEMSSMISHSCLASPAGSRTASVIWM